MFRCPSSNFAEMPSSSHLLANSEDDSSYSFFLGCPILLNFFSSSHFCLEIAEMRQVVFFAEMPNSPQFLLVDFLFTPFPDLEISNIILRKIPDMLLLPLPSHLFLLRCAALVYFFGKLLRYRPYFSC